MPRIKSLNALRPKADLAQRVASVPYDVVNREEAIALAAGNEDSFLHVIRPDIDLPADTGAYSDEVYNMAAKNLNSLRDKGTLVQDDQPSLYVYQQTMNGVSQSGVVACCHLDDYENELILKHEFTRPVKEDDRTRHVVTLGANTGPVFLTYRDDATIDSLVQRAKQSQPIFDFSAADGVGHTAWPIDNIDDLTSAFANVSHFYIADGHHRAASAFRARKEFKTANKSHDGTESYNWFLTVLFPANQLNILAYNRIVADTSGLSPDQLLEKLRSVGELSETSTKTPESAGITSFYLDGRWFELKFRPDLLAQSDAVERLDVAILEKHILAPIFGIDDVRTDPRIDFVGGIRGTDELEQHVESKKWTIAFSMYPTSIQQLMDVSDAGQVMPPKSTWFEPKLRSGLFVHLLD